MTTITFKELPSSGSQYLNVVKDTLTGAKPGLKPGGNIPRIDAEINDYVINRQHLAEYNQVCGFTDSAILPITYPHIVAFPLQMAIMNHDKFPLKLLGLVHVRNSIKQHRAIEMDEILNVSCFVEGQQRVPAGYEFDLVTTVKVGEEIVWEEISTNLARTGGSSKKTKKPTEQEVPFSQYATLNVPEDIGRRYGKVSGDRNPIHLYHMTAKLLGFNKAIAHGMWSLARMAAELSPEMPPAQQLDVAFKLPIFLPARVLLRHYETADGIEYKLLSGDGKKPHAVGGIQPL